MPYAATPNTLAEFQQKLVGAWKNEPFGHKNGKLVGGEQSPLSYNIMPLPEESDPDGYILKNFKYYESLKFNGSDSQGAVAVITGAPNRGGLVSQNSRALFYEQQIKFAEGPGGPNGEGHEGTAQVAHVENGAWLWLPRFVQQAGPYPGNTDSKPVTEDLEQPADIMIAKQMSTPHGTSIVALGHFDTIKAIGDPQAFRRTSPSVIPGRPVIPDGSTPYPMPASAVQVSGSPPVLRSNLNASNRYSEEKSRMDDFQNPHPDLARFPNRPLQEAVAIIQPDSYTHWRVTTQPLTNGRGQVVNVPFEQRVADVIGYSAEYWLLFKGHGRYLAYTQTIRMALTIRSEKYIFPHITCNTLTYISS